MTIMIVITAKMFLMLKMTATMITATIIIKTIRMIIIATIMIVAIIIIIVTIMMAMTARKTTTWTMRGIEHPNK